MRTFIVNEFPNVLILYGSSVQNLSFPCNEHSVLEDKRSDEYLTKFKQRLAPACDGTNSIVLSAIRNDTSGMVTSSKGVQNNVLYCSEAGFGVGSIDVKNDFLSKLEKVPTSFDQYWAYVNGQSYDLKILLMLTGDKEHVEGMLTSMSLPRTHPLLETKSANIGRFALQ